MLRYGTPVKVHWHFSQRRYSVSTYNKAKKGWRVVRDRNGEQVFFGKVVLEDAKFKVSQKGRERAIREKVRNVHAYVEGTVLHAQVEPEPASIPCGRTIVYNPFKYENFLALGDDSVYPCYVDSAKFVSLGIDRQALTGKYISGTMAKYIVPLKEN